MDIDYIEEGDCLDLIKQIPDNFIDLVVTDPPYEFNCGSGGGAFGSDKKNYHVEYSNLGNLNFEVLDECCRVLKAINIYVWCSKAQVRKLLDYFEDKGCSIDILTWHKTNPIPTCNNTYLSDTEYLIFAREKGVKVYGSYATKKKYYVTATNKADKDLYKHPTIKPIDIIQNIIINSSVEGDIVLDPFLGSGTTAVAAVNTNRHYIGFELNPVYYDTACKRLDEVEGVTI